MVKTKIKWTNHRDPKLNGKEDAVDAARAKVLARDGLAVVIPDDDGVDRSPDVVSVNVQDPAALPAAGDTRTVPPAPTAAAAEVAPEGEPTSAPVADGETAPNKPAAKGRTK